MILTTLTMYVCLTEDNRPPYSDCPARVVRVWGGEQAVDQTCANEVERITHYLTPQQRVVHLVCSTEFVRSNRVSHIL